MSHRLQIVIPDHTYNALTQIAAARESRPSTIAAAIITDDLQPAASRTKRLGRHRPPDEPLGALLERRADVEARADDHEDARPRKPSGPPAEPAAWLERGRGHHWRTAMWDAAMQLSADYPELNNTMKPRWHTDRFTRDGILALAIWRRQIDEHAENDPRMELQWLTALRDFCRLYNEHNGLHGAHELQRPADW